ncbi:HK97 gp10 family phage protein [[Clostridium] symbiosum]|uniref:HK97 gp10 family phage protein n=1 Tax=Clostridium symbiosum TaxID=1512 RepID=UPI00210CBE24|nr:HK97 gp10 family phage protein [[Clostridium] symbiosum]MCQ4833650.1 HK97 gp10 family phage protein [[Clostridium] symbiosum]
MAVRRVSVDGMAETIAQSMGEYADLSNEVMKRSVTEVSRSVKKDIQANAPVRTGKYKKSWAAKKVQEDANSLTMAVHSRDRYQIAHLLEHGHVKRGGGRVQAIPHIAPAEQRGAEELMEKMERGLSY